MKRKSILIENTSLEELVNEIEEMIKRAIEKSESSTQDNSEQFITRKEASEMLQVTYVTLRSWHKKNVLKAHSIGNRVYYKTEDIQKAMQPNYYD